MADMTCIEVQRRLQAAHRAIGGRFTLTLQDDGTAYVCRWYLPQGCAFEDATAIGHGTLDQCFEALDRYVLGMSSALMAAE